MQNGLCKKGLIVGIIVLFIGVSVVPCIQGATETQKTINQTSFERVGLFITVSSGWEYTGIFPIIRTYDKPYVCFLANIDYYSLGGWTRVRKIGSGLVYDEKGEHSVFFHGLGLLKVESRVLLPNYISFIGVSVMRPVITR